MCCLSALTSNKASCHSMKWSIEGCGFESCCCQHVLSLGKAHNLQHYWLLIIAYHGLSPGLDITYGIVHEMISGCGFESCCCKHVLSLGKAHNLNTTDYLYIPWAVSRPWHQTRHCAIPKNDLLKVVGLSPAVAITSTLLTAHTYHGLSLRHDIKQGIVPFHEMNIQQMRRGKRSTTLAAHVTMCAVVMALVFTDVVKGRSTAAHLMALEFWQSEDG